MEDLFRTKEEMEKAIGESPLVSKIYKKAEMRNKILPEEMQELMDKVEKFYIDIDAEFNIFQLAKMILTRLKSDRDFFMSIEGIRGSGKSNFMLLLMLVMSRYAGIWRNRVTGEKRKVNPRMTPPAEEWDQLSCSFDFEKNLSFLDEVDEVQEKFNSLDRYMPFGIDEGSKNLHKQRWATRIQFKLVQMSDSERYQNKAFFVCFPNFKELNSTFRNGRIMMRIYLYTRNTAKDYSGAIVSFRDPSRWTNDPWHIQENERLFEYILRNVPTIRRTPEKILSAERKLKGYAGNLLVPNLRTLAPRIWKTYLKYKIENAQKQLSEDVITESRQIQQYKYAIKKMTAFLKYKFPQIKFTEIAKLTNMSPYAISKIWHEKIEIEDEYAQVVKAGRSVKSVRNIQV